MTKLYALPEPAGTPIVCAPWCRDGDGHADEVFEADQVCWSEGTYVDLGLEPGYGVFGDPARLGISAIRRPGRSDGVYVHIDTGRDVAVNLTASEARAIAAALVAVVNEIG